MALQYLVQTEVEQAGYVMISGGSYYVAAQNKAKAEAMIYEEIDKGIFAGIEKIVKMERVYHGRYTQPIKLQTPIIEKLDDDSDK